MAGVREEEGTSQPSLELPSLRLIGMGSPPSA
jgi:hypothetical protein